MYLQQMAGNTAVSGLVADLAVQRQEDPEDEEAADEAATEAAVEEAVLEAAMGPIGLAVRAGIDIDEYLNPEEYGETAEAAKNPQGFPNAPANQPGEEPEFPEPEFPEPEGPVAPSDGGPASVPRGPSPGAGPAGPGGIPGLEPIAPGAGAGPVGARPMLRVGSRGDAVRDAQVLLVRHGATIEPDGQFGPATRRAVITFQRSARLSPDGIIGPLTWRALESS